MKVFEVIMQYCEEDGKITTQRWNVTSDENTLSSVAEHFAKQCQYNQEDLKGGTVVCVISEHVKRKDGNES